MNIIASSFYFLQNPSISGLIEARVEAPVLKNSIAIFLFGIVVTVPSDKGSVCSSGYPQTYNPPASSPHSQVLGLQKLHLHTGIISVWVCHLAPSFTSGRNFTVDVEKDKMESKQHVSAGGKAFDRLAPTQTAFLGFEDSLFTCCKTRWVINEKELGTRSQCLPLFLRDPWPPVDRPLWTSVFSSSKWDIECALRPKTFWITPVAQGWLSREATVVLQTLRFHPFLYH